jgi:hypothetical protein
MLQELVEVRVKKERDSIGAELSSTSLSSLNDLSLAHPQMNSNVATPTDTPEPVRSPHSDHDNNNNNNSRGGDVDIHFCGGEGPSGGGGDGGAGSNGGGDADGILPAATATTAAARYAGNETETLQQQPEAERPHSCADTSSDTSRHSDAGATPPGMYRSIRTSHDGGSDAGKATALPMMTPAGPNYARGTHTGGRSPEPLQTLHEQEVVEEQVTLPKLTSIITSAEKRNGRVLFVIDNYVHLPNGKKHWHWCIRRRYSQFYALWKALKDIGVLFPAMPRKITFGLNIDRRRRGLQRFVSAVAQVEGILSYHIISHPTLFHVFTITSSGVLMV